MTSATERKKETRAEAGLLKKGQAAIPQNIKPMLATLVDKPFDDANWLYEVKWDGYRAVAYIENGRVEIQSRNNKSFTAKYYPITEMLSKWKVNAVLDGEIVVLNEQGKSNFGNLQNWRSEADGHLTYYVFDILWYEGKNLMGLPFIKRREILEKILPKDDDRIRLSQLFKASGTDFFAAAEKMGLEGIIAKKAESIYIPDLRSRDWLKIKTHKRQEVVIGGFTQNEGSSKAFSSLLLGVYENDIFHYVGKVGTGFSDKLQKEMMAQFKPLITTKPPFNEVPDYIKPSRFTPNPPKAKATWLKPQLVCEISFAEVTSDGVFRDPSFEGLREDKKAKDVTREFEKGTQAILEASSDQKIISAPKDSLRKTLLNP